jgi:hypothetical protein
MKTSLYFVEMEASLVKLYNREYFPRNKVTSWTTPRPNNLSLVCLYLSLYISFLLFGYFIFLFFFLDYDPTSPLLRAELSGIPLKYKSQSDWLKYL